MRDLTNHRWCCGECLVNGILRAWCDSSATIGIVVDFCIEEIITAGSREIDRLHTDHVRSTIEIGIRIVQCDGLPITDRMIRARQSVEWNFTRRHIESRDFFSIDPHNGTVIILDAQRKRLRYLACCDGEGIAIIHCRVHTLHARERRVDNIATTVANGCSRSRPVRVIENQLPPITHWVARFFGAAEVFPCVASFIQINDLCAREGASRAP